MNAADEPIVSIIVPAFNRAELIGYSINSLLKQTEPRFEVIVVDDCSTDSTVDVVNEVADPRVRCVRQVRNQGPSAARNAGVRVARAPLIAFQDSDDEWVPDKLRKQLDALAEGGSGVGAVYCDMLRIHCDGEASYHRSPEIVRGRLLNPARRFYQSYCLGIQTTLVRRELFERVGGLDERMRYYEDLELYLRLAQVCEFRHVSEALVHYYDTGGLTSSWRQELAGRQTLLNLYGAALARESRLFAVRERAALRIRSCLGPLARGWVQRQTNLHPPDWRPDDAVRPRDQEQIYTSPPHIPPPPRRSPRPLWSVIIPLYNPQRDYFEAALRSVLDQDPGSEEMQICVIDDGSRDSRMARLVEEIGGGRVEFHRRSENGGLGAAWNTGLKIAAGEWVHLLHQDDLVLPGFYSNLKRPIHEHPELGAAYVQHFLIDSRGRRSSMASENPAMEPGVVADWLSQVFERLTFQTPSVVVKREAYEKLGGFRMDFRYALDWDMWKRVAASYPIWYDPTPLAAFRRHRRSTSMNFLRSGENMVEIRRSIELSRGYLPEHLRDVMSAAANRQYALESIDGAIHGLFTQHEWRIAVAQFQEARKFGLGRKLAPLTMSRFTAACGRWVRDRFDRSQIADQGNRCTG